MQNCSFSCEVLGTWTIEADVHEHVNSFILFSFSSIWSHLYLSFHNSWNFRVFLVGAAAGVAGVMLISWSCFPPRKEFSELWTCFRLDISTNCFLKENIDESRSIKLNKHEKPPYRIPRCISFQSRTQTFTCQENAWHFLLGVFETFVFRNSSFALTLLALFSTIQKQSFIGKP